MQRLKKAETLIKVFEYLAGLRQLGLRPEEENQPWGEPFFQSLQAEKNYIGHVVLVLSMLRKCGMWGGEEALPCQRGCGRSYHLVIVSIGDPDPVPDPDPQDPHVFGPPGSGSISQWYGSGSGSGSFLFSYMCWADWNNVGRLAFNMFSPSSSLLRNHFMSIFWTSERTFP